MDKVLKGGGYMSLKGGMPFTELFDTIDDARKGKKSAINKLKESLSPKMYEELVGKYEFIDCIKKDKKYREASRKVKSILAVIILFVSMLCGLVYVTEQFGKETAILYILLWIWSISFVVN